MNHCVFLGFFPELSSLDSRQRTAEMISYSAYGRLSLNVLFYAPEDVSSLIEKASSLLKVLVPEEVTSRP